MIPMGETINHPKRPGHQGIDFRWNDRGPHRLVSSSDGHVSGIHLGATYPGKWDIHVAWGVYELRYKRLEDYNRELTRFSPVKQGDFIGYAGVFGVGPWSSDAHWELASQHGARDRWCPVTYFDPASRASIEALWDRQPLDHMKTQFPDICSGDYKGKEEKP
jgi:murein DD-endopeptidase MepM/ murein hydrolase activator NlpD